MEEEFKEYQAILDSLPEELLPLTRIDGINMPVTIHTGNFQLGTASGEVNVQGEIYFSWSTEGRIRFKGQAERFIHEPLTSIQLTGTQHSTTGYIFLTSYSGHHDILGVINPPLRIINEPEIAVKSFRFELSNFKSIFGEPVRSGQQFIRKRLVFGNSDWTVKIDEIADYKKVKDALKDKGGFGLSHTGEIQHSSEQLTFEEFEPMIKKLGVFLSFLNGSYAYPCFVKGFDGERVVWTDFSTTHSNSFLETSSWLPQSDFSGLSGMWTSFMEMADDPDDLECLDYIIHWYIEANRNSGFTEGSVVLLQNAFELLFNWQMVEKREVFTRGQAKNINAAEKIRILLNDAGLSLALPPKYTSMDNALREAGLEYQDFPQLFTLLRNAITHTDMTKRATLSKIQGIHRFHIKDIGIACLELLVLYVLNYRGVYASRVSEIKFAGGNESQVPWNPEQLV